MEIEICTCLLSPAQLTANLFYLVNCKVGRPNFSIFLPPSLVETLERCRAHPRRRFIRYHPRSKRRSPWSPPRSPSPTTPTPVPTARTTRLRRRLLRLSTLIPNSDGSKHSSSPGYPTTSSPEKYTTSSAGALGLIFASWSTPAVEIRSLFVAPSLLRRCW